MKITLELTEMQGRDKAGWSGDVWTGHTAGGCPIEVLIVGMRITSDDPVDLARFKLEAAIHGEIQGNA